MNKKYAKYLYVLMLDYNDQSIQLENWQAHVKLDKGL